MHGGTYTRRYRDLIVPGYARDAYGCALYLAHRGHTVVTLDMLGIGESTVEISGKELKTQMMAQAIAVVIEQMKQKVARFRLQLMSPFPCCWDSPRRMSQPILLKMHCIFPKHPHVPRLFSRLPLIAAISPPHAPTCGR